MNRREFLKGCAAAYLLVPLLTGRCVAEPFRDGDTVVFFGDSITHGGLYHKYIADFYRTRYPERKIRFVNSGIGGDSAAGAMKRIPFAKFVPGYVEYWPRYREVRAALLAEQEKVYSLAQPKSHRYQIRRK